MTFESLSIATASLMNVDNRLVCPRRYEDPEYSRQIQIWIDNARRGDRASLGYAIDACRPYLLAMASKAIPAALRSKFDPADLVQETALFAHRDFGQFAGSSRQELWSWLRKILLNNAARLRRQYQETRKRQVSRDAGARFDRDMSRVRANESLSPGARLIWLEQQQRLDRCLTRLPSDTKTVIELRNHQRLPFAEIGRRMQRSEDAARKLWSRAIERLRRELGECQHYPQ